MTQFLYNSSGTWVAFKIGNFLYNSSAHWIGWFPWGDEHAVDKSGRYLGSIFHPDRFYRLNYFPYRGYPGYPGYAGYSPRPSGTTDITKEELLALA